MAHIYIKKNCIITKRTWDISAFPDVQAVKNAVANYNEIYGIENPDYPAPYVGHKGTDYLIPSGTPIYGLDRFVVNGINHKGSRLGNHIEIGNGRIAFIVAHLSQVHVIVGQNVSDDLIIGLTGNTGVSQGPHLHIQTWLNDVDGQEKWVDSTPYMNGDYPIPFPVQEDKNILDKIADEVIQGAWGNGDERKKKLEKAGYNAPAVQYLVNNKLAKAKREGQVLEKLANEVIRGEWGNGQERKNRLRDAGHNAAAIQQKINDMLK